MADDGPDDPIIAPEDPAGGGAGSAPDPGSSGSGPPPPVRLLPPNATPAERALEKAVERLSAVPHPIAALWDPWSCPPAFLPLLAWGVSIDHWNPAWPDQVKRARIAAAIPIQRRKGTAKAVRDVVAALGGAVAVREWFEPGGSGEPYTFELVLTVGDQAGVSTADFIDDCIAEVNRTKPARAHFTFVQGLAAAAALGVMTAGRPYAYARLEFEEAS